MTPATAAQDGSPVTVAGGVLANPYTGGTEWMHGTTAAPQELEGRFTDPASVHPDAYNEPDGESLSHWSALLGTHFTADHEVADEFASGQHESQANSPGGEGYDGEFVVHAELAISNPKIYPSEHDMDHEAYEHELAAGNHPGNYLPGEEWDEEYWPTACAIRDRFGAGWLNSHPDKLDIAVRFRERLQAAGHDGVIYGNTYEQCWNGAAANQCAIALDPDQIRVTGHHELGELCADRDADREAC